ncbi:MAG TPA: amino acid adenylation domain-containing protein [Gemmatimonadaceae bacterium]|nr:amino acid adenylation domain-containing protein [Gemmatimonadaceae bacterium]
MSTGVLHEVFFAASARWPDRVAAAEPDGSSLTYAEMRALVDHVHGALKASGVVAGDRVGVYLPKTIDSVACILGALAAGAAYVPVDPGSPPARAAFILSDCAVRVVVTTREFAPALAEQLSRTEARPVIVELDGAGGGHGVQSWLDVLGAPPQSTPAAPDPGEPAYLLYTSGSTGNPKGVVVSHRAARAFVDWCSITFQPNENDRFSSHAPFHFDLSIHDLYVSLKHGARVVLIGEDLGKDPGRLAELIERERLTIWYSTPSILSLLEEHGRLDRRDCSSLRIVHFAGEVFPIPRLRKILARWPHPRFFNLYGPTETNVCTWYEVPKPFPADRTEALPIGAPCAHYSSRISLDGVTVPAGERGELLMTGPGVMSGYWNLPERNAQAFVADPSGTVWYRTGDIVSEDAKGVLLFHGRRDRMVKRRGYRIELGEIEAGLARHPAIGGVAVVAKPDEASGVQIHAFLVARSAERPSIVDLKRYCVDALPRYMAPDRFTYLDDMPQTSTDKTDYQALAARA